jgi:hypothetical protein
MQIAATHECPEARLQFAPLVTLDPHLAQKLLIACGCLRLALDVA